MVALIKGMIYLAKKSGMRSVTGNKVESLGSLGNFNGGSI